MTANVHYLRQWRLSSGLTLADVAKDLNITEASVSRIERGLQPYNQNTLQRFADLYKCKPSDLLSHDAASNLFAHNETGSRASDRNNKNGGPNYLAHWREFRNLTQAALAEKVGTNANMVGYLESGERGLSAKWLRRFAVALDTTPGMLLVDNT